MKVKKLDLVIIQGSTFHQVVRWEEKPVVWRAIQSVSNTAPVSIGCTGHGLVDGWRCVLESVKGPTELNRQSEGDEPRESEWRKATVIDANTIEINDVNAASLRPYASGGYVRYNTPVGMSGYTARMSIKDKRGGTELLRLDTTSARIVIDNTAKTITLTVSAADTEDITWTKGVYDLEMVSPTGVVTPIMTGVVTVSREVTTT